jgi:hypothetical protein
MQNMVSDIKAGKAGKQCAEENFWTKEKLSDRRSEQTKLEELHNLYSSPSIIRKVKASRMRWAESVARMGK